MMYMASGCCSPVYFTPPQPPPTPVLPVVLPEPFEPTKVPPGPLWEPPGVPLPGLPVAVPELFPPEPAPAASVPVPAPQPPTLARDMIPPSNSAIPEVSRNLVIVHLH